MLAEGLLGSDDHSSYPGIQVLNNIVSKSISEDQKEIMGRQVSREEIKEGFFSLKEGKAPGPDGFNALFFKRAVVREDVLDAILSFFYSGSLLRKVNNTIIAKVPKIPNATKLSNYRLISCCNTINKCLTKLIANRV